jgi:2-isopropylmalate synthase
MHRELVRIGFKEIEVAYPSASKQEFQFVRSIIENGEVPNDVSLQVGSLIYYFVQYCTIGQIITPARADLIARSIESLSGARHAIIHLYNAVSPVFREVVFRHTKEQTIEQTLNAVRLVKKLTEEETARSGESPSHCSVIVILLISRYTLYSQLLPRNVFPN